MTGTNWSIAPYFIVNDIVESADYYREKLGFEFTRYFGEPPSFTIMNRNGVSIMLKQLEYEGNPGPRPNRLSDAEGESWDAYIWVDDADALHAEFVSKGVKIARGLCTQEYGCRDFRRRGLQRIPIGLWPHHVTFFNSVD